jgi:O-antigen/teichoic acid export membrane protein
MLKKLLDLLSDAAVYGISSMLSRLVGLLLLPLLTRYLAPAEYGVLVMLSVVSMLFAPLARMGMTNAIFRRFNLEKDPRARSEVLVTGLVSVTCTSLVLLAIGMVFAGPIARVIVGDPGALALVRVSLLSATATAIGMVPFVSLRAARRVKTAAMVNVSKVGISMLVTVWLLVVWQQGIWAVVWATLFSEVALTLAQLVLTSSSFRAGFDWATWKRMASYGLPFVPHHLQAVGVQMFGLYMVREMLGLGAAGVFGVATRFASPITFIVGSVQQSWVPYKFQIHAEDADPQKFFESSFTYYVAALSYLWVGVALWGPEAVRLIAGAKFHDAAFLIWAVALIPVAQGLYFMSGTGIELSDNTRPLPLVSLAGLVVVVAAAFLLVPWMDAMGAALATSIGWLVMTVMLYTLSQRRFAIFYDWSTIARFVAMATVFVAVGGIFVEPLALWPRLALITLLSLAYPVAGFAFLLRSRDERGRMLHLLSKFRIVSYNR